MKRIIIFVLISVLLLSGCSASQKEKTDTNNIVDDTVQKDNKADTEDDNTITIWLDHANESFVRQCVSSYKAASKTGIEEYPPVSWNIVDKSYLTAGQYQRELEEAMDAVPGVFWRSRGSGGRRDSDRGCVSISLRITGSVITGRETVQKTGV